MIYIISIYIVLLMVILGLLVIIYNLDEKCKQLETMNFYYEKVNHLLKNKLKQYKPFSTSLGTEA